MINLNKFSFFAITGVLVGALIGGVWARIAMRIVALMISGQGSFTLEGTVGILVMAALFGLPFGLIFGAIHGRLRIKSWLLGLLYGLPWMLLFSIFFFVNREGELSLLPAWQGALLFAPLFLVEGIVLALITGKMENFLAARKPRLISRSWFVLYVICLTLAFVGMSSLMGSGIRLPKVVSELSGLSTSDFPTVYGTHRMIGFLFLFAYLGLTTVAFVLAGESNFHRLATLATLLFAAGWFNIHGMAAAIFVRTGWVDLLSWLVRLVGAAALFYLLLKSIQNGWLSLDVQMRQQSRPVLLGLLIALCSFGALWIATLLVPSLTFHNSEIFAPLSVTVYLLPWLAVPAGLLIANLRRN